MTKNSDFKSLVRARMAKTGESYTAARAHLAAADDIPTIDEYADLAGMSDESVREKTGLTWLSWVEALDERGAAELSHRDIARRVGADWPELSGWWVQTVTVGYERIRGLRAKGQLCTGDFAASKSKTFAVPIATLYAAFSDEARRAGWMGEAAEVRTAQSDRSMRLSWPDGTVVSAWFTDKGAKSAVAIQHEGLPTAERRESEKAAWGERLTALAEDLRGG